MKSWKFALFFFLVWILSACPGSSEPSLKKVQNNRMDFPDLEKRSHKGIHYQLSSLFKDSYYTDFVVQNNATTKSIFDMHIHFSVETFDKKEIESIRFEQDTEEDDLNTVHNYYIRKRLLSLEENSLSLKKKLPKNVGFSGFIQVVEGGSILDEKWASYFTASVKVDENVHVFQLIGPKDHMGHFYDDFLSILYSIEK